MSTAISLFEDAIARERHNTMLETLELWLPLVKGKKCLDFGCGQGSSSLALIERGAATVIGVDIRKSWVEAGQKIADSAGYGDRISLLHFDDTANLPFPDREFEFILAQAVFEHISKARGVYLRELWRLLAPGGHLMLTETPNLYWPRDDHTTNLWFNHWLPERLAYARAIRKGRSVRPQDLNYKDPVEWPYSGWRGMGYHEIWWNLRGEKYRLLPETSRARHRALSAIGVPASIVDPYPTWVLKKTS